MEPGSTQDEHQNRIGANGDSPTTYKIGSPSLAPPYWQHGRAASYASQASIDSTKPRPITLEDNTETNLDRSSALWARSVTIDDYVLVQGNRTGLGAYVVWNCKVQTLDVRVPSSVMFARTTTSHADPVSRAVP